MKARTVRNAQGSGLVEGVVGIVLVTMVVVAGILLLVNSGMATYYKLKIGYVASEAAKFANAHEGQGRINATKDYAESLLRALGIKHGGCHIELDERKLNGVPALVCKIECRKLDMLGNMMGPIEISDVGVAPSTELLVKKTVSVDAGDKNYHLPVFDDGGKQNLGDLGTKGYLAVNTENAESQPRLLHWILSADYKKEAEQVYGPNLYKPKTQRDLENMDVDFPKHSFNKVYYVEVQSGAFISKNL